MKTTADRLHEIMEERGLKQADIIELAKPHSEKYGVKLTRPDMSQYCSGKVKPTQGKLFLLAAALDVDEAWLMGYDVPQKRKPRYAEDIPDSPLLRAAKERHSDIADDYMRRFFDEMTTDEERDLIYAFRNADDHTKRMVEYMLRIKEIKNGNR